MAEKQPVVVKYKEGTVLKGYTYDFYHTREIFHIEVVEDGAGERVEEVIIEDLKAIFFVRTHEGKSAYEEKKVFKKSRAGMKIFVKFQDGEVLIGTTLGYGAERRGFFISPPDPLSNNLRVYVVKSAVKEVKVGTKAALAIEKLKE